MQIWAAFYIALIRGKLPFYGMFDKMVISLWKSQKSTEVLCYIRLAMVLWNWAPR